jgi:catechol 2,3-dioxygenase-like lactoylglutathione lyase family enzyme
MHLTGGTTVFVPVADQDRALAFYTEALGFTPGTDFRYADGARWLEVTAPGERLALSLVESAEPGIELRFALGTRDVEADHAALGAAAEPILREGDPPVRWGGATLAGIPPMFLVRDPDGNSLLIVQHL